MPPEHRLPDIWKMKHLPSQNSSATQRSPAWKSGMSPVIWVGKTQNTEWLSSHSPGVA